MERDMLSMGLSEARKEDLRARWRQNETDYLREQRRKVDVSAFIKLKTIGHGAFGVVSLVKERITGKLFAMKQVRVSFSE
jgi:protein-serine/threonine kinase